MIPKDRLIVAPWGEHGLVTVARPLHHSVAIASNPHDDRTALRLDFPKFRPGSRDIQELGRPLSPRVSNSVRVGIGEANQGTDVQTIVVQTINFFDQIMMAKDHFPPHAHPQLLLELRKHKKIWDNVVQRSNGLYVSGKNSRDLFKGMTTEGQIPYIISSEGWSTNYDSAEIPYDQGAKDIARFGIVQSGGWNHDDWVQDSHGSTQGRGMTPEGKEWHRALAANGVTIWDGSHGHIESIKGMLEVAGETNQSHVRVIVSHAGVQMGSVETKTRNPSKDTIERLLSRKNSFFGIATSSSMLPGDTAEAVADAAEYLLDLDPTGGKQIGLGFDTNGKGGGTILKDVPNMMHLYKIAEALSKRPRLKDLVEDILWRNYANFLLQALTAREHAQ